MLYRGEQGGQNAVRSSTHRRYPYHVSLATCRTYTLFSLPPAGAYTWRHKRGYQSTLDNWQRQSLELVTGGDDDGSGGPGTTILSGSLATSKEWMTSTPVWYDVFLQFLCLTFH